MVFAKKLGTHAVGFYGNIGVIAQFFNKGNYFLFILLVAKRIVTYFYSCLHSE